MKLILQPYIDTANAYKCYFDGIAIVKVILKAKLDTTTTKTPLILGPRSLLVVEWRCC